MTISLRDLESLPAVLKPAEVAELTRTSVAHTYRAIQSGEIPSKKVGSRILVPTLPLLEQLGLAPEKARTLLLDGE